MKYIFLGDRGEIVGHAVFTANGQTVDLDPAVADTHIANGFPLDRVVDQDQAAPEEVTEHVSA